MKMIAIESPFAARGNYTVDDNIQFARNVCRQAILAGHAPFAMHLHYPQCLDDNVPEERALGIECGLRWTAKAEQYWFCLREGERMSSGMVTAICEHDWYIHSGAFFYGRFTQNGELIGELHQLKDEEGFPEDFLPLDETLRDKVLWACNICPCPNT